MPKRVHAAVVNKAAVWGFASGVLSIIFFAVALFAAEQASMTCGNNESIQTQAVRGPSGTTAVLKASAQDDASKNSHLCMADYQLLIAHASDREPKVFDFLSSDGEWNRELSVHLSGFSQDGRKIFGVITEGGASPTQMLFDCDAVGGQGRIVDLKKQLTHVSGGKCRASADVLGTTDTGDVVLQLTSSRRCLRANRWLLDVKDRLRPIPDGASVVSLYK